MAQHLYGAVFPCGCMRNVGMANVVTPGMIAEGPVTSVVDVRPVPGQHLGHHAWGWQWEGTDVLYVVFDSSFNDDQVQRRVELVELLVNNRSDYVPEL